MGSRAVVATRALLETAGSFNSLDVWLTALNGDDKKACESSGHCKRLTSTMAKHEREVTYRVLKEGAVFRLQADGLERTYQVEIGTVLWSLLVFLKDLPAHGEQAGWLEALGPRGPWIVERIIGMQEFPQAMDCDGKVSMLEACVRRACLSPSGELDTKLHQHVRGESRAWCSDGADLNVPLAASAFFPRLVFHGWDEAHSAQKVCPNSMKDDFEIRTTDELLVTSKKPYSLAKFLSTSAVFRKKVGDAQVADEIAFVICFGWAPQRFNSRARPYAREARRWNLIFETLSDEAEAANKDRRTLARMYFGELGGDHSSRLALGGMLGDLSAEHYHWVAGGDKKNPDAAEVESRDGEFLARLDTLFTKGFIITMPDTFTGVTLEFLKTTSYFQCGNTVQTIGIGDWEKEAGARQIITEALGRVQNVVANMVEYMKVYRHKQSWLYRFCSFRLPSSLSESDDFRHRARIRRICDEAELPFEESLRELLQILLRAEKYRRDGCNMRAAWGRAAAEWPEFQKARRLIELFLIWKTATSNLERRFRRFREISCVQRAQLLDTTVEECMLVEQAPPSKMLRALLNQQDNASNYLVRVSKLHAKLQGKARRRIHVRPRRDAGSSRPADSASVAASARSGPETEAAFGRKRNAAVAEVVAASASKRARMIRNAPLGLTRVMEEAAEESRQNPAVASAAVVSKVAKRGAQCKETFLRGAQVRGETSSTAVVISIDFLGKASQNSLEIATAFSKKFRRFDLGGCEGESQARADHCPKFYDAADGLRSAASTEAWHHARTP